MFGQYDNRNNYDFDDFGDDRHIFNDCCERHHHQKRRPERKECCKRICFVVKPCRPRRKFDPCNSYPEQHHDERCCEVAFVCCR